MNIDEPQLLALDEFQFLPSAQFDSTASERDGLMLICHVLDLLDAMIDQIPVFLAIIGLPGDFPKRRRIDTRPRKTIRLDMPEQELAAMPADEAKIQ
jgi:hypothetical protein